MSSLRIGLGKFPLLLRSDVIYHVTQMIIRILIVCMSVGEEVLRQFEDD